MCLFYLLQHAHTHCIAMTSVRAFYTYVWIWQNSMLTSMSDISQSSMMIRWSTLPDVCHREWPLQPQSCHKTGSKLVQIRHSMCPRMQPAALRILVYLQSNHPCLWQGVDFRRARIVTPDTPVSDSACLLPPSCCIMLYQPKQPIVASVCVTLTSALCRIASAALGALEQHFQDAGATALLISYSESLSR